MAYSAEVVSRARARLAQAKEDRESENRQHLAVAYARVPRIREIDMRLRQTLAQAPHAAFQPGSPLGLLQLQSLRTECLFPEGKFFFFRFYLGQLAPGRIEPLQPLQGLLQLLRLAPGLTALLFQPGQLLPQGLLFVRRQQGLSGQFLAHVLQQERFLPVPFVHQK